MIATIDLTGQVAFVTGGGAGIGRAIALTLAGAGANIAIAETIPQRAEAVAAEVRALGRSAIAPVTDVTESEQVRIAVDEAAQKFGRIDILVNNVGGVGRKPFLEMSERSWRRQIDLNFVSMLSVTSAAAPLIVAGERGGAIINISSIEGLRAAPMFSVYAACKAAMHGFTRTLALELAGNNIRVNALAVDSIDTPGTRGNVTGTVDPASWFKISPEQQEGIRRRIPAGRLGLAEECGQAALFLASPMSSFITGAILSIDGGTSAAGGWVRDSSDRWTLIETPAAKEPT